jgi:hypothetical protein
MIGMKYKRRRAEPPLESSMYDGSELLGTITPRAGLFAARMASGLAIRAASRVERAPSPKISEQR